MHKDEHFNDLIRPTLHDSTSVSSLIADIKMIILHMYPQYFYHFLAEMLSQEKVKKHVYNGKLRLVHYIWHILTSSDFHILCTISHTLTFT